VLKDEELVQRHLLGDEAAFPELLNRHIRSVYNLAYRSTGDVMEAENIVQEAFARAYAAMSQGRCPVTFRPWLLTIAINLCRNQARRAKRLPVEALADDAAGDDDSTLDQLADPAPGPLAALLQAEDLAALEAAVAALPLFYRQAVILRYMEGLSYDELAQVLGLPLNTVRTHLRRAKERLRRALLSLHEREDDGLPGDVATLGPLPRRAAEPGRGGTGSRPPGQLPCVPESDA